MLFVKGFFLAIAILIVEVIVSVPDDLKFIVGILMITFGTLGYRVATSMVETRRVQRRLGVRSDKAYNVRQQLVRDGDRIMQRAKVDWRQAGLVPAENIIRNYHIQPNAVRIGDNERDQIIAELSEHYQAGRLKLEEYDERITKAMSAVTGADLCELVSDLPLLKRFPPDAPKR